MPTVHAAPVATSKIARHRERLRAKVSAPFGRLDDERMKAVDRALLLVVGVI